MSSTGTTEVSVSAEGIKEAVTRHWWVVLLLGIASIIIGIWAVATPVDATETLGVIFAVWLVVTGIFEVVRAFATGLSGGLRTMLIITGILSLVIGLIALRNWWETGSAGWPAWFLAIFVGVTFLFRGFANLFGGIEAKGQEGRGWTIFAGIVYLIAGIVLLIAPTSLLALVWVLGIYLIVLGAFEIIAAFMIRSGKSVTAA